MNFDELYKHATLVPPEEPTADIHLEFGVGDLGSLIDFKKDKTPDKTSSSGSDDSAGIFDTETRYSYTPKGQKTESNIRSKEKAFEARRKHIIDKLRKNNYKDRSAMIKDLEKIYNSPAYKQGRNGKHIVLPPGTNLNKEFPLPKKYGHRHPLNFTSEPETRKHRPYIPLHNWTPYRDIILPKFKTGVWAEPGAPASNWDTYDDFYKYRDSWGKRYWDDRGSVKDTYKMPTGDEKFDPENWLSHSNINWKDHIRTPNEREGSFFNHNDDLNPGWVPPKGNPARQGKLQDIIKKNLPPAPVTADANTNPNTRKDQQNLSTTYQNDVNKTPVKTSAADIFGPILRQQDNEEKRKRNSSEEIDHSKEGD